MILVSTRQLETAVNVLQKYSKKINEKSIVFESTPDNITITAYCDDMKMIATVNGIGPNFEKFIVNGGKLLKALKKIKNEEIEVSKHCFKAGNVSIKLQEINDITPTYERDIVLDDIVLEIPFCDISRMIKQTKGSCDPYSNRYSLSGILLESDGEKLNMVATDSRVLAVSEYSNNGSDCFKEFYSILPVSVLKSVLDIKGFIALHVQGDRFMITSGMFTIIGESPGGRFPNWRDVYPEPTDQYSVNGKEFIDNNDITSINVDEETKDIYFKFSEKELKITHKTKESEISTTMNCDDFYGDPFHIEFDTRLFKEYLNTKPETLTFGFTDKESCVLLSGTDNFTMVVMPLSRDK